MWLQAGLKDHQGLALPVGGRGASLTPPVLLGKMGIDQLSTTSSHVPSLKMFPSHRREN